MNAFAQYTLIASIAFLGGMAAYQIAALPLVKQSWTTQQCVSVSGGGSCEDLPARYNHEWVK